jgi:colanic acid/amylovoran biosynthesis glycosyltransferase
VLILVHQNWARLRDGVFHVDRKFHTGMQEFLTRLDVPVVTLHPELPPERDGEVMDLVALPQRELGYLARTVPVGPDNQPVPAARDRLRATLRQARLLYGWGLGAHRIARQLGVPYVPVVEYNVKSTLVFASAAADGVVRKVRKRAGALHFFLTDQVPMMRRAVLLHCNGYPIFEESRWLNRRRLLYLDSRMRAGMIIEEAALQRRLVERRHRRPRLLFSGRFEPAKGALDVVLVAAACKRRGLDFEMHLYGQGSERPAMDRAVREHGLSANVFVHEAIPYPQLVEVARASDLFVCCHVQDDPSCTYLESLGCGLPIVGYGNAMWRAMCADSRAGLVTPPGAPAATAEALARLLADPDRVDELSRQARRFAVDHAFEREFSRRIDSLAVLYRESPVASSA